MSYLKFLYLGPRDVLERELSVPGEPIRGASISSGCKVPPPFLLSSNSEEIYLFIINHHSLWTFFPVTDQYMPAGLIRMLLLMAGVERNPGPDEDSPVRQDYFCTVCTVKMKSNTRSVKCSRCKEWVHKRDKNNCSKLKRWKDYDEFQYVCPTCLILSPSLTPCSTWSTSPPPPPPWIRMTEEVNLLKL